MTPDHQSEIALIEVSRWQREAMEKNMTNDAPYPFYQPTIQDWLSALTSAGFDVVDTKGYTSRTPVGEKQWNGNYPMVHTFYHMRHCDPKTKAPEYVLNAYACYGSRDFTVYAAVFSGKSNGMYAGFHVKGKEQNKTIGAEKFDEFKTELYTTYGDKYRR